MNGSLVAARRLRDVRYGDMRWTYDGLMRAAGLAFAWISSRGWWRNDLDALRTMDDRLLDDIGLTREHVTYAVHHGTLPDWGGDPASRRRRRQP
ncbi:MAG: DUF1127 domain-containing protein [Acetobacteraceae bacterium]